VRRCGVRAKYASRLAGYPSIRMGDAAFHLSLFEQPEQKKRFSASCQGQLLYAYRTADPQRTSRRPSARAVGYGQAPHVETARGMRSGYAREFRAKPQRPQGRFGLSRNAVAPNLLAGRWGFSQESPIPLGVLGKKTAMCRMRVLGGNHRSASDALAKVPVPQALGLLCTGGPRTARRPRDTKRNRTDGVVFNVGGRSRQEKTRCARPIRLEGWRDPAEWCTWPDRRQMCAATAQTGDPSKAPSHCRPDPEGRALH
jgi:hypothetical protein